MHNISEIQRIEDNLRNNVGNLKDDLLPSIMSCYGFSRVKSRVKTIDGDIIFPKKMCLIDSAVPEPHTTLCDPKQLQEINKYDTRFIIVRDADVQNAYHAKDIHSDDNRLISFTSSSLHNHVEFFLPLKNNYKVRKEVESIVDRKSAERMGLLYDAIMQCNTDTNEDFHDRLNIFFSRILFCFFAENTNLFQDKRCFSKGINKYTKISGEDLQTYLTQVFRMLNIQDNTPTAGYPKLPFVNGGLFKEDVELPKFSRTSRDLILKCGDMNWSEINPDIFGSMMQAAIMQGERSKLGQHYTADFNILKCLNPLFLNKLNAEFEDSIQIKNAAKQEKSLNTLLAKLRDIIIFDPACGSGNFLIVAYEHLRRLENRIFQALQNMAAQKYLPYSGISLSNFYGIEINALPVKLAQLSLWIKQAQMDIETKDLFSVSDDYLPLRNSGNITRGNALKLDWQEICPITPGKIVYVTGNPPFKGEAQQSKEQKNDMILVFNNTGMDYVCCWFKKAADYIQNDPRLEFAFVSTNSLSQGQAVHRFWPRVLEKTGLEIHVGYLSFKWQNKAKGNAGVTCNIIGMRHKSAEAKYIYDKHTVCRQVDYISPSLADYRAPQDMKRQKPISNIPEIMMGAWI